MPPEHPSAIDDAIDAIVDEWVARARSTGPADRARAERAVSRLYQSVGRPAVRA